MIQVLGGAIALSTVEPQISEGIRQVQQYNFSIGILAMLLVGFGIRGYRGGRVLRL